MADKLHRFEITITAPANDGDNPLAVGRAIEDAAVAAMPGALVSLKSYRQVNSPSTGPISGHKPDKA